MNYTVRQSAGQLLIQVQLRQQSKSAPLQLTGGDRLTVEFAGKVTDLKEDSAGSTTFVASFAASAAQPSVKVSFVRTGQSYSSMATVPPRFEVLSPSAAVAMNRQSADLDVVLQLPAASTPSLVGTTHCVLQSGSAWDGSIALPFERVDGNNSQQRLRLPAAALARAVDNAFAQSTSKPQACRLQPSWVLIQDGAAPAGLHAAGTRQAQFAAGVTIDFDAKP
ncbi:hypothetical protein RQP53_05065 [Paucibacter sp. APW11]|uniref:Uncharacterized protein n=1 Tax=Roseateles aquae TaxID=3077235 RepID=A0ABU3P816_9BURK|nr:hypothetical protein [Paucibacter sp. APW11]MDT8998638.1 hypothetical protein [Paucibacter sp. APW11]